MTGTKVGRMKSKTKRESIKKQNTTNDDDQDFNQFLFLTSPKKIKSEISLARPKKKKVQTQQPTLKKMSYDKLKYEENQTRKKLREIIQLQKKDKENKQLKVSKPSDNKKLKELILKYRQFKERLSLRDKEIEEQEEKFKQQHTQLQQEIVEEKCDKKREKISQRIKDIQRNRKLRMYKHQKQKQALKRLHQEKLYARMEASFERGKQLKTERQKRDFEKIKKAKFVDLQKIRKLQKSFNEKLQERERIRNRRIAESRVSQDRQNSLNKSKIYEKVVKQDMELKLSREQRVERARQMLQKHKNYYQRIRLQLPLKQYKYNPPQATKSVPTLNRQERQREGIRLFEEGQSQKMSQLERRYKRYKPQQQSFDQNQKIEYMNYLPEVLQQVRRNSQRNNTNAFIKEVIKINNRDDLDKDEKKLEIKYILAKLDTNLNVGFSEEQRLVKGLKFKLDALQIISNS